MNIAELNKFVAVTKHLEFSLGKPLLNIDTGNTEFPLDYVHLHTLGKKPACVFAAQSNKYIDHFIFRPNTFRNLW